MFLDIGMFRYLVDIRFVIAEEDAAYEWLFVRASAYLQKRFLLGGNLRVHHSGSAKWNVKTSVIVLARSHGAKNKQ